MALADISAGPIGSHSRTTASPLRRLFGRAFGLVTAIAMAFRPGRMGPDRPIDVADLSDRMKQDIGLPPGLFGPPARIWSDYR